MDKFDKPGATETPDCTTVFSGPLQATVAAILVLAAGLGMVG